MKWLACILVGVLATFAEMGHPAAEKAHHPHYPWVGGIKLVGIAHSERGTNGVGGGGGLFFERAIIEDALDVELSLLAAVVEDELLVPLDFIAKTPLWASHTLTLYAGAGISLTYEHVDDETLFRPGIAAQGGVYLWPWEHTGIDLEIDYNLLLTPHTGHELNVAVGPIMRF